MRWVPNAPLDGGWISWTVLLQAQNLNHSQRIVYENT
jgi:hypothetical protein